MNSDFVRHLEEILTPVQQLEAPEGSRLNVHAAIGRVSALYERIRNAVEYADEHVLRRAAMKRILQRQFVLEADPFIIAGNLLRELIAAGYLPNNQLPEQLVHESSLRIQKYQAIVALRLGSESHFTWLRGILAAELEECCVGASSDKALATFLYERLADRIRVVGSGTVGDVHETRMQTYIACHRILVKADDDVLGLKLMRAYVPEWMRPDEWIHAPASMGERLIGVQRRIRTDLTHPLALAFQRVVKPWAVALNFIKEAGLEDPEALQNRIASVADRKYAQIKGRVRRGAVRATLYLLVTKMLIALAIEVPLERLWYGSVAQTALFINLVFPPLMMAIVALTIRLPGKENTARIQANVETLLSDQGIPPRDIRAPQKRRGVSAFLFRMAYLTMCVITFGGIGVILFALNFTWLSALLFYFFLCVVSFFIFRLRHSASEYVVVEHRERLWTVLLDFIFLPILRVGRRLSQSISRLNVFLFIFDFLIEAPFKLFLEVLEEWFAFLREKKEELS